MNRNRLIKAALGAGCVMSLGLVTGAATSTGTTMCTETELAGMSYTLDMFCSLQSGAGTDPEAIVAFADMLGGNAASGTSVTGDALIEEETTESDEIRSDYENVGISIAADYVNIRMQPDTEAEIVGKLYRGSAATIVEDVGDWVFIKSGTVEGYIRKDYLAIGYSAEKLIDEFGTKWATVTTETLKVREEGNTNAVVMTLISEDESYPVVKEMTDWVKINVDDDCIGYVSKDYVQVTVQFKKAVSIEEEREEQRRREAAEAAEAEAETTADNSSSSSNGSSNNNSSSNNDSQTGGGSSSDGGSSSGGGSGSGSGSNNGGGSSNGGSSSGGGSSSDGGSAAGGGSESDAGSNSGGGGTDSGDSDDGSAIASGDGSAVASYALQFVGNPYVYGGTSLTNGTDCSGFTMSVYAHFGISLPRTSSSQSTVGKRIDWRDAQPGDLIFYGSGGSVSHVALCIGGGRVVHASSSRTGIKTSPIDYRTPITARRVLG